MDRDNDNSDIDDIVLRGMVPADSSEHDSFFGSKKSEHMTLQESDDSGESL
ncbi:hypothetical protein ACF044_11415 [Microbacterium sp. NPDC016588]